MKQPMPPRLARLFFKWWCGNAHSDDLVGDLDEWFAIHLKTTSPFQAKLWYWRQVLSLSFSYALRKRKRDASMSVYTSSTLSVAMFRNYIKVAVRNLYQYKYFSLLNAFGLAIGMSVSLLLISIYSYISNYDSFQENQHNLYGITSNRTDGVDERWLASAPMPLADQLEHEFTGAADVVRIHRAHLEVKTEKEDIPLNGYFAEPGFLSVFTYELLQGHAQSLSQAHKVILTQSTAFKLFSHYDVVGKTFELAGLGEVEVVGLMKDPPKNSHLAFELLLAHSTLPESKLSLEDQWTNFSRQYVYVLLHEHVPVKTLRQYLNDTAGRVYAQTSTKVTFEPVPILDLTMAELSDAIGPQWEISGFLIFGVIAALILLPACFNYTNISIARALKRTKEIGLRKTMGGVNHHIFFQFITETVVIAGISFTGALLIFILIRTEFQSMLVHGSTLDLSLTWRMGLMFLAFTLATGLLSGIFPALYFAGLNPIQALKSKVTTRGSSGMKVRKVLTVFQFALSFGFILSLVVFSRQYQYSLNFDFGFDKKNRVDVLLQDVKADVFTAAFERLSPVQSISFSSGLLGVSAGTTWARSSPTDSTEVSHLFVDAHYINQFGLTFLAGTNFPNEPWQRERYIIVNEEFLNYFQIATPADALGRTYTVDGNDLEVIGVLKNFHFAPLQFPIGKFFFRMNPSEFAYANLQVATTDAFTMFTQMEQAWKQFPTDTKFKGKFFEDEINESYGTYHVLLKMVGFLGLLAITISLLGMLGMVVYTSETKTKEVGIRKVMGASVRSIILLLSKDYLTLMLWAITLAVPVTAFLLHMMLPHIQHYSITLSVWDVLFSAFVLFALGILTIISQTHKTASANPAETLRAE